MAGPTIIVLGNDLIAKWVREKVVCGVEHCVALVGHTVFLILARPSKLLGSDRQNYLLSQADTLIENTPNNTCIRGLVSSTQKGRL